MKIKGLILLTIAIAGCNSESTTNTDSAVNSAQSAQSTQTLRHDFTSISPLYDAPYSTVATAYVEDAMSLIITLQRGELSCVGECELPITGQTPTGQGSTLITVLNVDRILTNVMIDSSAKSRVCYELASGWFVKQYFYNGEVTYKESQYDCNTSLVDTDVSNWDWDSVLSVTADIRGSGVFAISER